MHGIEQCDHEHGLCTVWGAFNPQNTQIEHEHIDDVLNVRVSTRVASAAEHAVLNIDVTPHLTVTFDSAPTETAGIPLRLSVQPDGVTVVREGAPAKTANVGDSIIITDPNTVQDLVLRVESIQPAKYTLSIT